jgi:hypothetical protein
MLASVSARWQKCPDGQTPPTKDLDDLSTHSAETPRGARDEDRCFD